MSIMKLKSTRRFVRPALSAATMMLLAACSQSYPGLEYEFPDNEIGNTETYNKTPIMMFVNEQNFFSITATRGMGAFENDGINQGVSQMQKQKATLYVYSFRNGQDQQGPLTSEYTITAPKNEKYNLDTATGTFKFLPGFQYTVKIAVYGLSPIKVTANISNWKEGGDIFINPDDADNIGLGN